MKKPKANIRHEAHTEYRENGLNVRPRVTNENFVIVHINKIKNVLTISHTHTKKKKY